MTNQTTLEAIEELNRLLKEVQVAMMESILNISLMWCPHCDSISKKSFYCPACSEIVETEIPVCQSCESKKIYHDKKEEYHCVFCE